MPDISIRNLYKTYGGLFALNGVTFDVNGGDFINIVGGSGGGKTTLLKCIAGLLPITAGELYIDGEIANGLDAKDRSAAMIFQEFALYPNYTVFENIEIALKSRKMSYEKRTAKVWDIIDKMGLEVIQGQLPNELSYGQKQKVSLARALVAEPDLILFDEPLSNIDERRRDDYRNLILDSKKACGNSTYLYVTHNIRDALMLGNKTLVIDKGRVLQYDETGQVFRYPYSSAVAQCMHDGLSFQDGIYQSGVIESEGEKIKLTPFMQVTCRAEEGEKVRVARKGDWFAVFNERGDALCGACAEYVLPAKISDGCLVISEKRYPLEDLKEGLFGQCAFAVFDKNLFSFEQKERAVEISGKAVYADGENICLKIDNVTICVKNACSGKQGDNITLWYPLDRIKLKDANNTDVLASYALGENIAQVKVLDCNTGTVSLCGYKFSLGRNLPKGIISIKVPLDAFYIINDKRGGLKCRTVYNIEITGEDTIVHMKLDGFGDYVSGRFEGRNNFFDSGKRIGIDGTKVLII